MLPLLLPKMDRGGKPPSMHGNPDADIMRDTVKLLREGIEQGLLTIFIKIKAHRGDPLNELADKWADEGRQSENIRWSLPTKRPIFYWTDNSTTHRSPMNPTVKKRIDLQVSQQQLKIHTGSTANFLIREDNSRDLLGKFHKDRSVWIRARRRVLQYSLTNSPERSNLNNGAYSTRSNAVSVKNIIRKKIYETPQTRSKAWDIYNATARCYNFHD